MTTQALSKTKCPPLCCYFLLEVSLQDVSVWGPLQCLHQAHTDARKVIHNCNVTNIETYARGLTQGFHQDFHEVCVT